MTQFEEQLNNNFEEILKEIRTNKTHKITTDEEDVESRQPGPSNSRNKGLRSKHASNTTIERHRDKDGWFYPSEMGELRQPYTPFGIANETLDETIIINENRQEADHHIVTEPTKNILRQSSNNSNTTITVGPNAEHLFLEHSEPSDPVSQIAQAFEKLAKKNPEPSIFHPKNTLTFFGKLEKNEKFECFEDLFHTTLKMQPHLTEEIKVNHFHASED